MEIYLVKQKWLICYPYSPNKHNISKHIEALSKSMDLFFCNYENILLMGDFNAGLDNAVLKDFCNLYNLTSLVNKATCYKNPNNPFCIDLLLKPEPKIISYRNYRYFSNDRFREKVTAELSKVVLENSDKGFNKILGVCKEALNRYAPLKKKYIRGNKLRQRKKLMCVSA